MKTKEELDALKQEVEALNAKLTALSEDELAQVAGGNTGGDGEDQSDGNSEPHRYIIPSHYMTYYKCDSAGGTSGSASASESIPILP